jgi:hypothetical protein
MKKWRWSSPARPGSLVLVAMACALAWVGTGPAQRERAHGLGQRVAQNTASVNQPLRSSDRPALRPAAKPPERRMVTAPVGPLIKGAGALAIGRLPGGRDPFRLPPPPSPQSKKVSDLPLFLPPGPAGLLIRQIVVEGIVDGGRQWMAVVTNRSGMAYFLHPHQSVYDGFVSRITPDAVYFVERVPGTGRSTLFRTVVKRLGSAQRKSR